MKTIITIIIACLMSSGIAQQINYRMGAILGRSELYAVVGTNLFPVFPKWKVNAEAVAFTPLAGVSAESPAYAGAGLMRRWNQPEGHSFELGASFLTEVGNGWNRLDLLKFGISAGARF